MALASACGVALLLPSTLSTQSKAQSETPVAPQTPALVAGASAKAQPATDPSLGASTTATAPTAAQPAVVSSTLVPVTQVAPLPVAKTAPVASKAAVAAVKALPASKMRLRAIVAGKVVNAEIEAQPRLTVSSALKSMGVTVDALDRVFPEASTRVYTGMTIRVQKVATRISKKSIPVPAQLLYRPTTAIPAGAKQQVQAPRQGKIEIVERIWMLDGKETRREIVSKRLAAAPRPRIIALGARAHVLPQNIRPHRRYASARGYVNSFRGGSPRDRMMGLAPENQSNDFSALRPLRCIEGVETTGYSAGPAGGAIGNWTATGVRCTYGAVAVDPRLIPLGSKLYIEGYGYGFACDTGGAIKGKHIDLAFDSPRAAFAHGRRRTRVWILGR